MGTSTEELKARMKQLKFPSADDPPISSFSPTPSPGGSLSARPSRPRPSLGLNLDSSMGMGSPITRRQVGGPTNLNAPLSRERLRFGTFPAPSQDEYERKLEDIMKLTGVLKIDGVRYPTPIDELEALGDLGNGTCGHVVKMKHRDSGKIIACKQMRRTGNSEETKRIVMDMDVVLKSHDCPAIVVCLGCFITASDVWICMELMATCFDKLLKHIKAPVPENICGKVAVATLNALNYLKDSHGVIHRDVKPSNILLDYEGTVKLCDFGISGRLVDSKAKTRSAGCAAYMAPERINPPNPNKPDYDIRADVWSLGITLVELATGHFPYKDCKTEFEVLTKVIQDDPPSLPAHFSPEFRQFVHDCLLKNHKDRPKYKKLLEHPFILKSRESTVDVGAWYSRVSNHTGDPNKAANELRAQTARKSSLEQRHEAQTFKPQPSPRMVKSWRMQAAGQVNQEETKQDSYSRLKFYTTNNSSAADPRNHVPELNLQKPNTSPRNEEYPPIPRYKDINTSPRYTDSNTSPRYTESTTSPRYTDTSTSSRYAESNTSPRYENPRLQDLSLKSPKYEYGSRKYDARPSETGRLNLNGGAINRTTTAQPYPNYPSATANNYPHPSNNYLSRPTYFNSRSHEEYSSALKSPQSKRYEALGGSHSETSSPRDYTHSSHRKYSFETLDSSKEHHYTPKGTRKYPPDGGPTSPRYAGETSPRYTGETSPRYTGEISPRYAGETSPRYAAESSATSPRKLESPRKVDLPHEWTDRTDSGSRTLDRMAARETGGASRKHPNLPVPEQARGREPTRESRNFLPSWKFSSWTLSSPLSFRRFRTSASTDRASGFDVGRRQHQTYRSLNERDKQFYSASGRSDNL